MKDELPTKTTNHQVTLIMGEVAIGTWDSWVQKQHTQWVSTKHTGGGALGKAVVHVRIHVVITSLISI